MSAPERNLYRRCDSCGEPAQYGRGGMWWCSLCWQAFGPWREPDGPEVVRLDTPTIAG